MFGNKKSSESAAPETKSLSFVMNFSFPPVVVPEVKLDSGGTIAELCSMNLSESNKIPKKYYEKLEEKNESQSVIGLILDDVWISLFTYLDPFSLICMKLTCKKIANLANDEVSRERLYTAKKNHFFKPSLPKQAQEFFIPVPVLPPVLPQQLLAPQPEYTHYNDNPAGQGFVMR